MLSKQSPDGGTVRAIGGSSVAGIVSTLPRPETHQQRQVLGGEGGMTPNQSAMVAAGGGSGPSTPTTA